MNCPTCNVALTMAERSGIEIDYCPKCRGVWLDRGELDKIIERASSVPHTSAPHTQAHARHDDDDAYGSRRGMGNASPERENPLMELFDFF